MSQTLTWIGHYFELFSVGLVLRVPGKLLSSGFSGPVFIPDVTVNIRGTWLDSDPQTCLPQQR